MTIAYKDLLAAQLALYHDVQGIADDDLRNTLDQTLSDLFGVISEMVQLNVAVRERLDDAVERLHTINWPDDPIYCKALTGAIKKVRWAAEALPAPDRLPKDHSQFDIPF